MACIYQTSSKILLSFFFLSPTASCCLSLSLSVSFGVAWSLSMSIGSYALWLWLWLCGCLFLLCAFPALSVCLQAPVLLSGSTLVLVPWFPWYYPCWDVHVLLACVGDRFK